MKMIPSLACFFLTCLMAPAATISVGRGLPVGREGLQLAHELSFAPYSGGYFIGVGTFATPPASYADLKGFMEFASGLSPTSGILQGYIVGSFTQNFLGHPSDASVFNSKEIYILVGNGRTLAESEEQVVLRSSGAPWLFPPDVTAALSSTSILARRNNVTGVPIDGRAPVFIPQSGGLDLVAPGAMDVPEASTSILSMLGLAFLSRRKGHH